MVTDHDLVVDSDSGIDTHADTHHVAGCNHAGRLPGDLQVPATSAGYRGAVASRRRWPSLGTVGIECPGSYRCRRHPGRARDRGAVVEPDKTDTVDAYLAADAVPSGGASAAHRRRRPRGVAARPAHQPPRPRHRLPLRAEITPEGG